MVGPLASVNYISGFVGGLLFSVKVVGFPVFLVRIYIVVGLIDLPMSEVS